MKSSSFRTFIRHEWFLVCAAATSVVFLVFGHELLRHLANPAWFAVIFVWLFASVLGSAIGAVRHADQLAVRLGEPYGTLILTLAVTFIEVISISAVMTHGANNPTLVRDTLFAVVMIILNGMVGLSLLLGAWRHQEQTYNLQGANSYLGVIIPLVVLSLLLPNYTVTTPGPFLSVAQQMFLVLVSVGLYATFLMMQTGRHRRYFRMDSETHARTHGHASAVEAAPSRPLLLHGVMLLAYLVPVAFLAEHLARPVDYLVETLKAPAALGGVVMAVLVATPEAIGAVRAAMANHIQRSVNIFLGSVLSTIGLTIPAMLIVSHLTGRNMELGVENTDVVLLVLTLAVSVVTFASGRTNVIQGAVHLILFAVYLLLIVQG
jgi:Ca2+:H+ antiporter